MIRARAADIKIVATGAVKTDNLVEHVGLYAEPGVHLGLGGYLAMGKGRYG
jgi:hypothetical protein